MGGKNSVELASVLSSRLANVDSQIVKLQEQCSIIDNNSRGQMDNVKSVIKQVENLQQTEEGLRKTVAWYREQQNA